MPWIGSHSRSIHVMIANLGNSTKVSRTRISIVHTKAGTTARPKLNAALCDISARFARDPACQRLVQQLESVLGSKDGILPAAAQLGRLLVDAGLLDEADWLYRALAEQFRILRPDLLAWPKSP